MQVGGCCFHEVSFQQARNWNIPPGGVHTAFAGYMLSNSGVPGRAIVKALNGVRTERLSDFLSTLLTLHNGARVPLRYVVPYSHHQVRGILFFLPTPPPSPSPSPSRLSHPSLPNGFALRRMNLLRVQWWRVRLIRTEAMMITLLRAAAIAITLLGMAITLIRAAGMGFTLIIAEGDHLYKIAIRILNPTSDRTPNPNQKPNPNPISNPNSPCPEPLPSPKHKP